MPCTDGGPSISAYEVFENRVAALEKHVTFIEATLCATLTYIESRGENPATVLNWKEAGTNPAEVMKWWANHKEKDRIRKEKEEARRKAAEERKNRAKIKAAAIAKLTPEELRALGIK